MFSAETIKKIDEVLHISDFDAKLKSDKEETLEVPVLITEDEKNTFGTNRFNEGKKAASEILVKDLKTKHGIESDSKSIDTFLEKYSEKVIADAKIKPDEQVEKYKKEAGELRTKLQAAEQEHTKTKSDYESKLFDVQTTSEIRSHFPDKTADGKPIAYSLPVNDLVDLFKLRHRVANEDGSTVVYKGTTRLNDKVLSPIPLKDVVAQFAEGYVAKGGMGGGDNGGGGGAVPKFKTASEAYKYLKDHNIEPMGQEGLKMLNDNKDAGFDPNK